MLTVVDPSFHPSACESPVVKGCVLIVTVVLAIAAPAAAKNLKVYIFVAPQGADGFRGVPRTLADSAEDLGHAVSEVS
jgi:diadenosine tetraphosphate (Ap4A) HIT family hydrolase